MIVLNFIAFYLLVKIFWFSTSFIDFVPTKTAYLTQRSENILRQSDSLVEVRTQGIRWMENSQNRFKGNSIKASKIMKFIYGLLLIILMNTFYFIASTIRNKNRASPRVSSAGGG